MHNWTSSSSNMYIYIFVLNVGNEGNLYGYAVSDINLSSWSIYYMDAVSGGRSCTDGTPLQRRKNVFLSTFVSTWLRTAQYHLHYTRPLIPFLNGKKWKSTVVRNHWDFYFKHFFSVWNSARITFSPELKTHSDPGPNVTLHKYICVLSEKYISDSKSI